MAKTLPFGSAPIAPVKGAIPFGSAPLTKSVSKPSGLSPVQEIKSAAQGSFGYGQQGYEEAVAAKNPLQLLAGSAKFVAGGLGTLASPLAPIINRTIAPAASATSNALSNTPLVRDYGRDLSLRGVHTNATPLPEQILEGISNVSAIAGAAAAPESVVPGLRTVSKLASTAKTGLTASGTRASTQEALQSAMKRVTPDYGALTPTQKAKLIAEPSPNGGVLPRVQEGGKLSGRTVTPTVLEGQAAAELAQVPGYKPEMTHLQTYQLIQNEIANRGQALSASLKAENILVPRKELVSTVSRAVHAVPDESLLLSKTDPVLNNYIRVAENAAAQNSGTIEGVLDVRKALDNAYKNARGKLAFGDERISALDEVHTAGRDALTQYLVDHARSTDVKASLKSQWNLYRAGDAVLPKASKEAASSFGRAAQNHPIATKVVKSAANAIKLGAAVKFGEGLVP